MTSSALSNKKQGENNHVQVWCVCLSLRVCQATSGACLHGNIVPRQNSMKLLLIHCTCHSLKYPCLWRCLRHVQPSLIFFFLPVLVLPLSLFWYSPRSFCFSLINSLSRSWTAERGRKSAVEKGTEEEGEEHHPSLEKDFSSSDLFSS